MRDNVRVRQCISDLYVAYVEVGKHCDGDHSSFFPSVAVILTRVIDHVAVDEPDEEAREHEGARKDSVDEPTCSAVLNYDVHEELLQV